MKMPIVWHEECLKNLRAGRERKRLVLERAESDWLSIGEDISDLEKQIEEAKRRGKDGFDPDKFLKTKSSHL